MPGLDLISGRLDNVSLDSHLMINRNNPDHLFTKLFSDNLSEYEVIIFDCPLTLGTIVCSVMLYSDLVISPLNPDIYSFEGLEIMQKERKEIHHQFNKEFNWRLLLNKHDSRTLLSSEYLTKLLQDPGYSNLLLKSEIRVSQDLPNTKSKEKTIFDTLRNNTAKQDINDLVRELMIMMEEKEIPFESRIGSINHLFEK